MDYSFIQFAAVTTLVVLILCGSFVSDQARQTLPNEMRLSYSDIMAKNRIFHLLPGFVGIPLCYLAQYFFTLSAEMLYGLLIGIFVFSVAFIHVATNRIIKQLSLPKNFFFSKQIQFSLGYLGVVFFTIGLWLSAHAG